MSDLKFVWGLRPVEEDHGGWTSHVWKSRCNRYRIDRFVRDGGRKGFAVQVRRITRLSNGQGEESIWTTFDSKNTRTEMFPSLNQAIKACEGHCGEVSENRLDLLSAAEDLGLLELPEGQVGSGKKEKTSSRDDIVDTGDVGTMVDANVGNASEETSKGDQEMATATENPTVLKVSEKAARAMLMAMGFAAAGDPERWNLDRLNRNLGDKQKMLDLMGKAKKNPADDSDEMNLLEKISEVYKDDGDGTVEVEGEGKVKGKKKAAAAQASKNGTAPKATKTVAKAPDKPAKASKPPKEGKDKGDGKMSILDATAEVMKRHKKPMNLAEILAAVADAGLWSTDAKTPRQTLSGAIQLEIKKKGKGSRFVRSDERGKFCLNK